MPAAEFCRPLYLKCSNEHYHLFKRIGRVGARGSCLVAVETAGWPVSPGQVQVGEVDTAPYLCS